MQLRNKKTGEIGYLIVGRGSDYYHVCNDEWSSCGKYWSLAELNEEWEDAPEEPKGSALDLMILTLANFIENEPDEDKVDLEDCEQMSDKLKAWRRLKDKGFRFVCYTRRLDVAMLPEVRALKNLIDITAYLPSNKIEEMEADLELLFGGGK